MTLTERRCAFALASLATLASVSFIGQRVSAHRPDPVLIAEPPTQSHESHQQNHQNAPRANQGRIPPAPPKANAQNFRREEEHRQNGSVDHAPHVSNDHWYGHDAPNDKRFHIDHPFPHGRFEHFGPSYRYSVTRIDHDHHRFWFPAGFYFQIADWDWPLAADWCWDCGDDFVLYEDPDHVGWYLLYNIHTGVYVHVTYLGA
jgi:hypothetical protein